MGYFLNVQKMASCTDVKRIRYDGPQLKYFVDMISSNAQMNTNDGIQFVYETVQVF